MIVNKVQSNPNFQAIKLSEKDLTKSSKIFEKLLDVKITQKERTLSQTDLYKIFVPHIEKESKIKAKATYILEEIFSEMSLKFFEMLNNLRNNPTLEIIIEELNSFIPSKDAIKPEYQYKLLDDEIDPNGIKVKKVEFVTEKDLPNPESAVDIEKNKNRLNVAIEDAPISEVQKVRVKNRAKGLNYREIALKDGITANAARLSVKRSIYKIQYENGNLPKELVEQLNHASELLGCDRDDFIKAALRCGTDALFAQKPETINSNVEKSANMLGCTKERFVKAALRQPNLFYQKPETLMNNVAEFVKLLGCPVEKFVKAGLKQPQLFYQKPETLMKNAIESAKLFGCPLDSFIKAALRDPTLFCQKPQTMMSHVLESAAWLGCSIEEFVNAALNQPSLFYQKKATLVNNVTKSAELLGCSIEEFSEIGIKNPQLLRTKPDNLSKKLKFENYYRIIQNKKPSLKVFSTSDEKICTRILGFLINKAQICTVKDLYKFDLKDFLKDNEDKTFFLEIPYNEIAADFISSIESMSKKAIGKNIFEFKIMEGIPQ